LKVYCREKWEIAINVVQPIRGEKGAGLDADSHGTEHRAIVDTHRHPIRPKLAAKMAERGFYDPKQEFPQTNAQDLIGYREFYDLEYAMPKAREEGVTLCLASNGGEVEWFARDLLKVSTGDALKILNDEYLEIRDSYPGEFALMANAHALEEAYGPIPSGIKEHVQIVEDVLPSPAERQQVFWKTSNRVFRLGLVDTDLVTPTFHQSRSARA
jgi:hypothetical protein